MSHVAAVFLECLGNKLPLQLLKRIGQRPPQRAQRAGGLHGGRKEIRADQAVRGQDDGPLDDVFQLPDVAGPRVGQQQRLSLGRNPEPPFAYLMAILFKEVLDEQRNVPRRSRSGGIETGNTFSR